MVLQFTKTNSINPDYQVLIKLLDAYLLEKDGDELEFLPNLTILITSKISLWFMKTTLP